MKKSISEVVKISREVEKNIKINGSIVDDTMFENIVTTINEVIDPEASVEEFVKEKMKEIVFELAYYKEMHNEEDVKNYLNESSYGAEVKKLWNANGDQYYAIKEKTPMGNKSVYLVHTCNGHLYSEDGMDIIEMDILNILSL